LTDLRSTVLYGDNGDRRKRILAAWNWQLQEVFSRSPPTKKADFARAATAQTGKQALAFEGTSEVQEVTVVGDWAFMWTKLRVVANPPNGAAPIVRSGHTLSVLRKEGGKRLFARDANLLAPEQGSNSSR
jgi:hypothetical protein